METDSILKDYSFEQKIIKFVRESNVIEGIFREPSKDEIAAHIEFLSRENASIEFLIRFVNKCQPDAMLRTKSGMDVRVGFHVPPAGGIGISYALSEILEKANDLDNPYSVHCDYETLHPFTDCNGRSGRVLWLWMMYKIHGRLPEISFLHKFYYQALEGYRK